jgi:hypothetical protein
MTAPTQIRPPSPQPASTAWLTGIHRVEEDTQGTPEMRADFARNALALVQPMSVLELNGDGALRSRLLREGHTVYAGALGQAHSASYPTHIQRIVGVTQFLGYGDSHSALSSLNGLATRLAPWGWMGFKILDRDQLPHWLPEEEIVHRDETWYRLRFRFDRRSGLLDISSRLVQRDDAAKKKVNDATSRLQLRAFTLTEMEEALARSGLKVEAAFGGWNGEPPDKSTKALWLIARKKVGKGL